ncbi:MAG: helix-turn-helix domain-containing protein [Blastocatellia bacterium]|nr:helix-turn-helix domain-containing protein [Blastocatellia bacterium]
MLQAYKYRLKSSKAITEKLNGILNICRELYNAGLQERREAYKLCGKTETYLMQTNQVTAIKESRAVERRTFSTENSFEYQACCFSVNLSNPRFSRRRGCQDRIASLIFSF